MYSLNSWWRFLVVVSVCLVKSVAKSTLRQKRLCGCFSCLWFAWKMPIVGKRFANYWCGDVKPEIVRCKSEKGRLQSTSDGSEPRRFVSEGTNFTLKVNLRHFYLCCFFHSFADILACCMQTTDDCSNLLATKAIADELGNTLFSHDRPAVAKRLQTSQ